MISRIVPALRLGGFHYATVESFLLVTLQTNGNLVHFWFDDREMKIHNPKWSLVGRTD